jgi:hypothetical protein
LEQSEAVKFVDSSTFFVFDQFPDVGMIFSFSLFVGVVLITIYFGGSSGDNTGNISPDVDAYSRMLMEAEAYKYSDSIGSYVDSVGSVIPGITG